MCNTVYSLTNVNYSYYGKKALSNINLSIKEGECIAILGANGSGKSTLLKILDALYLPKEGNIEIFGKIINEKLLKDNKFNKNLRTNIGFVFQDPDSQLFLPTVEDEIAFAPRQLGYSEKEVKKIVLNISNELNLTKLLDNYPFRLSEGEKKKTAIASIYTLNPKIWLLDEPIFSLDPKTQWWIVEFLKTLKSKGKTIVVATHNIGLAKIIADKCCILNEEHEIEIFDKTESVLKDKKLLERANLIHPLGLII